MYGQCLYHPDVQIGDTTVSPDNPPISDRGHPAAGPIVVSFIGQVRSLILTCCVPGFT
jgi:hypothetical protein